jgi:hypothetical protein
VPTGFACPACERSELQIQDRLELGGDDTWDEVALQVLRCACGFGALGTYREFRRGSLDSETVEHEGHAADEDQIREAETLIRALDHPAARRLLPKLTRPFRLRFSG